MKDYPITKVNGSVYRWRRPTVGEIHGLKDQGIGFILDLEGDAPEVCAQELQAASLCQIPWVKKGLGSILAPTPQELFEILTIITYQAPKRGVLIHCLHGVDRTGIVCAYYRMQVQRWTLDAAWAECLSFGFHTFPYSFPLNWKSALTKEKP